VHPLDKLLHFTVRKDRNGGRKYTPITSIDFMRMRAADSGEYAGSDVALYAGTDGVWSSLWASKDPPFAAMVTVWRLVQGTRCKFEAVARWSEYKPDEDFMWRKLPATMLAKCAEALALRKGFPRQLAGLYAKEEMDQAGTEPVIQIREAPTKASVNAGPLRQDASKPNAGDSDSRPSGAEVPAGAARPVGSIIDNTNVNFDPPPGFALIDDLKDDGKFLQVWWGRDAKGGWMKLSTKVPQIRNHAQAAFDDGVPVKLYSKDGKYLDRVERLDGGMSKAELAGTKWTDEQLENQSL
jgi:phage recombination protein Bet